MVEPVSWSLPGHAGALAGLTWPNPTGSWLAVLVHDHAERIGDYGAIAGALADAGAVVVGHDMAGHGGSDGEPALIVDFEPVVDDLAAVVAEAVADHPGLPVVVIGYAVGGMIAVRYTQRYPESVAALVLAAPVLGPWQALDLLSDQEIPTDGPYGPFRRETLAAIEECLGTIDFDHPLGDDLPALWLHGTDDELVPMADTRAGMDRVRGLRFEEKIYPGAHHDLLHGNGSAAVLADITEFVHASASGAGV
jgi:alpha-beta hydrolase superfamily lysophospholipase